jgi:rSAM/selenodomain-associated transferase 1
VSNDDAPAGRLVVVFARAPRPGTVKTRLAADVGEAEALRIYRELAERTCAAVATLPAVARVVAVTPDDGCDETRRWLGDGWPCVPQGDGDLGARMGRQLARAVASGARKVVIVGTDCPELDAATMERAFDALDGAEVVFGPALDGGYYLVGVRGEAAGDDPARLFDAVPWSSERTLAANLACVAGLGLRAALLAPLRDVDTAADWAAWLAARRGAAAQRD